MNKMMIVFKIGLMACSIFLTGGLISMALGQHDYIQRVTIFKDRAFVLRQLEMNLKTGANSIEFQHLPIDTDLNALKVIQDNEGDGAKVEILGVRSEKIYRSEFEGPLLQQKIEIRKAKKDEMDRLIKESQGLVKINDHLSEMMKHYQDSFGLNISQDKWKAKDFSEFIKFLDSKGKNIFGKWSALYQKFLKINDEISELDAAIVELQENSDKMFLNVTVDLNVLKEGKAKIGLQYLVYNASWRPLYDIRISSPKATIEQYALISQQTGEDWKNCKILLSNSDDQIQTNVPEISPFTLNYTEVDKVQTHVASKQQETLNLKNVEEMAVNDSHQSVNEEAINKIFEVRGSQTVLDGSEGIKLFILSQETNYQEELEIIAPQYEVAYRRGDLKNPFDWPILSGEASIFYNNEFIQILHLQKIPKGKMFHVNAGIDYTIKMRRNVHHKNEESGSLLGNQKIYHRYISSYLENLSNRPRKVTYLEQIPVSELEKVKVEMDKGKHYFEPLKDYPSWVFTNLQLDPRKEEEVKLDIKVTAPVDFQFNW